MSRFYSGTYYASEQYQKGMNLKHVDKLENMPLSRPVERTLVCCFAMRVN